MTRGSHVKKRISARRRLWVCLTWLCTWWMPWFVLHYCCGKRHPSIRMAWREKFTIYVLILLLCGAILTYIIGVGLLVCPTSRTLISENEIGGISSLATPYAIVNGRYYRVDRIVQSHVYGSNAVLSPAVFQLTTLGRDVSAMFQIASFASTYCPGFVLPARWDNIHNRDSQGVPRVWYRHGTGGTRPNEIDYIANMRGMLRGSVARDPAWIQKAVSDDPTRKIVVAWDRVYEITAYYDATNIPQNRTAGFFGDRIEAALQLASAAGAGSDVTMLFEEIRKDEDGEHLYSSFRGCMDGLFFNGVMDHRADLRCQITNYTLLLSSALIVAVIAIKLLASLQITRAREPEDHDKFVICMVPCYTESTASIAKTIDSIANLAYDDTRKLLFVVVDGMLTGAGNDRPTGRIVLDILGIDEELDVRSHEYQSLGPGGRGRNEAKVFSGLYDIDGHLVPFVVIIKVGNHLERSSEKPGNRGKRDSQVLLMRFLSRVYHRQPMARLELELYHHIKNVIGVPPVYYEYVMMVDADTEVMPDSLKRLVSTMVNDAKIAGVCGETRIVNERESWVTMIQVYEYFMSHHLSKAFESLFGSVTCLPGCFSMYRIHTTLSSTRSSIPVLISPTLLAEYSRVHLDTLHLRNLLQLGEDRYLTTLILKHFPSLRTTFIRDAHATTSVPASWAVFVSQRRRWINSTVHNLLELVQSTHLCSCFACFSMRFVVLIDLLATLIQPAVLVYIVYLIVMVVISQVSQDPSPSAFYPLVSIIMIAAIYGSQIIIFIMKAEWAHIGWIVIYLLATPIFSFYLPLYSFWHMDDFSWGSTRVVDAGVSNLTKDLPVDLAELPQVWHLSIFQNMCAYQTPA
ncbi:family 2 glycosyltransferase [Cladochytrium replicatum]|nr:family 2 glycosyltransferase [Cladochytrium replicatum]